MADEPICDLCGHPLTSLIHQRGEGDIHVRKGAAKRPAPSVEPEPEPDTVTCPLCGFETANSLSLGRHTKAGHNLSLAEAREKAEAAP